MVKNRYYHGSNHLGITQLEPRVSTHGQAWVYATTNPIIAAYFGGTSDDFHMRMGVDEKGVPYAYELYKGVFDDGFKGVKTAIYELEDSGFESGKTSWGAEVVSPNKTKVINTKIIDDLGAFLRKANNEGKFNLHFYEDTPEYKAMIKEYIFDRLMRYGMVYQPVQALPTPVREHWLDYYTELRKEMTQTQKFYIMSDNSEIKEFTPVIKYNESTPYVSATNNPILAAFLYTNYSPFAGTFGAGQNVDSKVMEPFFDEFYEGAFREAFGGVKCTLYEVENSGFTLSSPPRFSKEFISKKAVKVLHKTEIDDLYSYLDQQMKLGNLSLHKSDDVRFQTQIKSEVHGLLTFKKAHTGELISKDMPKEFVKRWKNDIDKINDNKGKEK